MSRLVTVENADHALALGVPSSGMPVILGWGAAPGALSAAAALGVTSRRMNGMDDAVPEATLLPTGALGRFGWPALQGHRDGRDWTVAFADWAVESGCGRLVLRGTDGVAGLALTLEIALSDAGVFTMRTMLANTGATPFTLDRCMAATMLVAASADRLFAFEGGWGREFHLSGQDLGAGLWSQESRRGRTSHDRSPTVFLTASPDPLGPAAPSYGLHLGWSGNHVIVVDRLEDGRRLVHAGELFEPGEMLLEAGQRYESPVGYFATAATMDGIGGMFRAHLRRHVLRWPSGAPTPRPVTLNTWEGNYFKHDLKSLKDQATLAAALGIERFVLDDGWFGRRDDDTSSLGDWWVDPRKYPDGLRPLVSHVIGLGMQFGLWLEPEMISPDSDLYRAHPDWALAVAGREPPLSRHQLVLDLARPEVADHVFRQIDAVLSSQPIVHVKWDMNRDLAAAGDADGRAAAARQTRAAYALMDRIAAAHPAIEIEACASGGARVDYGVLARTQRVWLSDGTDPLDRLATQAGASLLLPPEIVGAHVSASPNHVTRRRHTLAFRAIVAMVGHFGVELNLLSLTAAERTELARWIALHKNLRPVLHDPEATSVRHIPVDGRHVYGAITGKRIVVVVAQAGQMLRYRPDAIRIAGASERLWRIAAVHPSPPPFIRVTPEQQAVLAGKVAFTGADFAFIGLPVPPLFPESGVILDIQPAEAANG